MKKDRIVALAMAVAVATTAVPTAVFAQQQSTSLAGTAKDEAKQPYTDYSVRARDIQAGAIASTIALDAQGNFSLSGLASQRYLVELVNNKNGKVVCTEGPFDLAQTPVKSDVTVDCGKVPAAWWLVGAAAAAGITAGVVAGGNASAAR